MDVISCVISRRLSVHFSDLGGCLLLAYRDSPSHPGGQCGVHGLSHLCQGAQLLPLTKAPRAHPSGAHHGLSLTPSPP